MPKEFHRLIHLDQARSIVLHHLPAASTASVPLSLAAGHILAEKIISTIDIPGFTRASMDDFAVLAEDTLEAREDRPASLRLAGRVPMGRRTEIPISASEAADIWVIGRHDPAIPPRIVPVAEVLADHMLRQRAAKV